MPSTAVLFDALEPSGAETTGTWTQESIPAGATGPAAPVLYDGEIDFLGEPAGTYIYKYTVGGSEALVTVEWAGSAADRANSECVTAFYVSSGAPPPFLYTVLDDTGVICGKQGLSGDQLIPLAASWTQGTYSGDYWYFFLAQGHDADYIIQFTVTGETYGEEGVFSPAIEVFTHGAAEDCNNNVQTAHAASSIGVQSVQTVVTIPGDLTTRIVRFRIATVEGYEGRVQILIEGICPP